MLDKVNWFCVDNNVTTEKKRERRTLSHQYYVTKETTYKHALLFRM